MSEQQAGFRVGDEFFPISTGLRPGEAAVVYAVTGLTIEEIAQRGEESEGDSLSMLATFAMAVSRKHPEWPPEKVRRFLLSFDMDATVFQGGDDGADSGPPDGTPGGSSPETSDGTGTPPDTASE